MHHLMRSWHRRVKSWKVNGHIFPSQNLLKNSWTICYNHDQGDSSGKKITIIRGSTKIENKTDEADAEIDPLFNLGDRLIVGEVVKADTENQVEVDKDTLTYAFVYRRHSSSTISPFKLPFSYNLIWDSSGTRNTHPKAGSKHKLWSITHQIRDSNP